MRISRWVYAVAPMACLIGANRAAAAAIPPLSPEISFTAFDAATNHPFLGFSVALEADTAVAGAPALEGNQRGAAYVYVRTNGVWAINQQLLGSGAQGSAGQEEFGYNVALSGDTILVGAVTAQGVSSTSEFRAGAAYVFVRAGSTWSMQQLLTGNVDDQLAHDFGHRVALSGDTAFVVDTQSGDDGVVYVFARSATTWSLQQKLSPSDSANTTGFSAGGIAVSGDTALIGDDSNNAVYAFLRSSGTWVQQQRVPSADPSFGQSIALRGDTAVVGARDAAHVLLRVNGMWSDQSRLASSDGVAGDDFGYAVAISDDASTLLVGAPFSTAGGAAYVFGQTASGWAQQQELPSRAGSDFGTGVAMSGITALIGSPQQSSGGSAYFYAPLGTWVPALGRGSLVLAAILLLAGLVATARYRHAREPDGLGGD